MQLPGLDAAGQTVVIEKYFDSDDSGAITASDLLVQRIKVTDGQVSNIGGQRNLNVRGDEDGSANSAILTRLRTTTVFTADRLAGRFVFRVAPDGAGFTPFTASLTVNQADHGGSGISGRVMGTGTPQARATVLFTSGPPDDFEVAAVAMTDAAGSYSLKLPAGTYRPVPSKSGFVFDLTTGPSVTVNSGAFTASPDAVLAAFTRTIAGMVRDEASPFTPPPGVLVFGQSESGMFAITFADASGNYVFPATAGGWGLGLLEWPLAQLGMLAGGEFEEDSAGNATGFHLGAPHATALIYGTVRTPAGVAVLRLQVLLTSP